MKESEVIDLLAKCLNVPGLSFGANTVNPYKELQFITQKASYICTLLGQIKLHNKNLKLYKDDNETIENIKYNLKEAEEELLINCNELKDFYNKRNQEGWCDNV